MREEEISVGPLPLRHEQAHVEVHVLVALYEIERVEFEQSEKEEHTAQSHDGDTPLGRAQPAKD